MAMTLMSLSAAKSSMSASSLVSPELLRQIMMSAAVTMPRSP
jgi:hypothetical protein